jgi:cellulose synthase/poly-beta-1,6-N-acetylglucosamine synthase-like glycosyltransferase
MRPKISVIIPAYNAEETIKKTLKSLLSQNFSRSKYEVIIVDDGSSDKTKEIVSNFKSVKLVSIKHSGPAKARNKGVKISRGKIVVFTDSDCIPKKNWLKTLVDPFNNKDVVCVAGTYETLNKNKIIARFVGYEIKHRHEKMKKNETIDFVGSYNCAYRKSIFKSFKGFDESFVTASGEDPELSFRLERANYKIVFEPRAIVLHPHTPNIFSYLKKKFNRAFWKVLLYKKHPKKVLGDKYTPKTLFPQIIFTGLSLLFLLLYFLNLRPLYYFLTFLLISLFFKIEFYFFLLRKDKLLLFLSPFIIVSRNIVSIFGIICGIFYFLSLQIIRKIKKE